MLLDTDRARLNFGRTIARAGTHRARTHEAISTAVIVSSLER